MKDSSDESSLDKPTHNCMVSIISRTKIIKDELSPSDGFEMAESLGMKTEKKPKMMSINFQCNFPTLQKCKIKIKRLRNH
jgi:hypothetical protein